MISDRSAKALSCNVKTNSLGFVANRVHKKVDIFLCGTTIRFIMPPSRFIFQTKIISQSST